LSSPPIFPSPAPPAASLLLILIDEIVVGSRHRRELGDIKGLAASMGSGLDMLEPIVVRPDGRGQYRLVCGARRLAAAKQLGQTKVPVIVRNLTDAEALKAEYSENTHRKDFTLSEAVAIKRALEPIERAAAKERQREGGRSGGKGSGKLPEASTGNAADKAAKATGLARRTLEKAEAIVDAAEADPEKFGKFKEDMDRTGRANSVYRRLKIQKQAELIRAEPPPLPGSAPYRVIVIDPPWPYEIASEDSSIRGVWPYPTMSVAQIARTDVASIAHEDCIVWLWTTNYHMHVVFDLLKGWGFQHRTILTWAKDHLGAGDWLRGQTEHAIFAIRGKPVVQLVDQTTLLRAPVRAHSQKPAEFYDFVERLCPAPRYADLFSRYRHNEKWDCHGDEAPAIRPTAEAAE
jgi:N6-adenosine-specific RNA methylase IME4/ParB-like chromosome segregation protein Spo0J